jgi:hypothetical protein
LADILKTSGRKTCPTYGWRPDVDVSRIGLDGHDQGVPSPLVASIPFWLLFPPAAHRIDADHPAFGEVRGEPPQYVRVESAVVAGLLTQVPVGGISTGGWLSLLILEGPLVESLAEFLDRLGGAFHVESQPVRCVTVPPLPAAATGVGLDEIG